MTTYYLDTSALSKRYVEETGSNWVRTLVLPEAEHTLLTARITMVEIYSALARRKREGSVPAHSCLVAAQAFTAHSVTDYEFIELSQSIIISARHLLERQPLRAYDAVQLASALVANETLTSAQLAPLIFLCADDHLNEVAMAENLMVDNPNFYS